MAPELLTDEAISSIRSVAMLTRGRPFALGTRWRETREVFGRLDSAEMEVTAFERNRAYTITHHKAGVRIETAFAFEPHADGASVSIEFAVQTAGLPAGFLTPLSWAIAGKVRHVLNRDLTDLKKIAETPNNRDPSERVTSCESPQIAKSATTASAPLAPKLSRGMPSAIPPQHGH